MLALERLAFIRRALRTCQPASVTLSTGATSGAVSTVVHAVPPNYEGLTTSSLPNLLVNAVPVVYHPLYSAPQLRSGHRFPMQIFRTIHDYLLEDNIVVPEQARHLNLSMQRII